MQNLLNNVFNLLQTPNRTLEEIKDNISLSNALIIISFIAVFNYILHLNIYNPKSYILIFFEIQQIFHLKFQNQQNHKFQGECFHFLFIEEKKYLAFL